MDSGETKLGDGSVIRSNRKRPIVPQRKSGQLNQFVGTSELIAAAAGATEAVVEATAAFADPTDTTGRHTGHQGIVGDVVCDDSAGCDQSGATYRMAAYDGGVGSQRSTLTHDGTRIDACHRKGGDRKSVV